MSAEDLRRKLDDSYINNMKGKAKPGPHVHAVANGLSAFQWNIFETSEGKFQQPVLDVFGYQKIDDLRKDASDLIRQLGGGIIRGRLA